MVTTASCFAIRRCSDGCATTTKVWSGKGGPGSWSIKIEAHQPWRRTATPADGSDRRQAPLPILLDEQKFYMFVEYQLFCRKWVIFEENCKRNAKLRSAAARTAFWQFTIDNPARSELVVTRNVKWLTAQRALKRCGAKEPGTPGSLSAGCHRKEKVRTRSRQRAIEQ